ncbi:MAG: hypothetical protein WA625_27330, partial [Pseudolabrys sp.]
VLTIGAYQRAVGKPVTITNVVCDLPECPLLAQSRHELLQCTSAFGGKADMTFFPAHVCF